MCEYTRELELIKRLIDVADKAVEAQVIEERWSFEGVCHSFAKTVVEYSKAAYDNVLLGNFHAVNMICRAILENCVFLEILINHDDVELWKYYLVYSFRAAIHKTGRKSFLNDKRYDCRLDSQQRASNPLSSFQKDGHLHFEETVIRHIEEKSIPSFRNGRALSFQNDSFAYDLSMMNLNDSFRNDRGSAILK